MKRILLITLGLLLIICNVFSQVNSKKLTDEIKLTYKDLIQIRLELLAAQISSGSYNIIDMGKLHFPVSIDFNEKNEIIFEIEGDIKPEYAKDIHEEIITESFFFVEISIKELFRNNHPQLNFDFSNNIIGYWYYEESEGRIPKAKWQSGKFFWINP
jgi:hypothetical protein